MFKGRYLHTLDAKGRLSIPSRFRDVLAQHREETIILTSFDNCLWGFPQDEWEQLEEKIRGLSMRGTVESSDARYGSWRNSPRTWLLGIYDPAETPTSPTDPLPFNNFVLFFVEGCKKADGTGPFVK